WIAALGWFWLHGALTDFWEAAFAYNRVYASLIAADKSAASLLLQLVGRLYGAVPVLLMAGLFGIVLLGVRRLALAAWLIPWVLLSTAAVHAQRQLADYHFLLIVPGLALAAAYGVIALVKSFADRLPAQRIVAGLALVALSLLATQSARAWYERYEPDLLYRRGQLSREAYLASFDSGPFSPLAEARIAAYLRENTIPGDGVLVWGLSPGIYALSGRQPVTRYPFHHVLLTDSPLSRRFGTLSERRERFIERLQRDPPAYILVGTNDRNGFEPEDSLTQMLRFPELRSIVQTHYKETTRIGRFVLYARS
ncbi:MAG: hypothetical protein JSV80_10945, partial [Acidobacteriota bacterium]